MDRRAWVQAGKEGFRQAWRVLLLGTGGQGLPQCQGLGSIQAGLSFIAGPGIAWEAFQRHQIAYMTLGCILELYSSTTLAGEGPNAVLDRYKSMQTSLSLVQAFLYNERMRSMG